MFTNYIKDRLGSSQASGKMGSTDQTPGKDQNMKSMEDGKATMAARKASKSMQMPHSVHGL